MMSKAKRVETVILAEKIETAKLVWKWKVHEPESEKDEPPAVPAEVHWVEKPTEERVRVAVVFAGASNQQPKASSAAQLPVPA